jgi:hypothetical protein
MAGRLVHGAISLALMRVPFERSAEIKLAFLEAGSAYADGNDDGLIAARLRS